ncbi:uncharacterized protein plekhg6 [Osmerus eperlanus]|uniref:uncharacterized protein plekhg6 n=1 Tax=Osmerus eperlanus TaxID=29151 RepID=UPI002E1363DB
MDLKKLSLSIKTTSVNNGGDGLSQEDAAEQWRDGEEREKEGDSLNGGTTAADTATNQLGAVESHTFNTLNYQRRTQQKVVTDYATMSKGSSPCVKSRTALKQVLFNQGAPEKCSSPEERDQLDVLKKLLQIFPVPLSLRWSWGEGAQGSTLENSWTEIVRSHTTMCKTQRHQQEALWEFVHTELTYINKLTIVTDLVVAALNNLHQHGFLQEVTSELLFSNLPSILGAHRQFWQEVMYPMLREVRRTGKPFDPLRLESGCLQFHERFFSYLQYCWKEESTLEFTRRELDSNPHFNVFLHWVETHPQCERMRLGDMQAKPHQRITKYPLLLKAIIKTNQDPLMQHSLRAMLTGVNGFLDSINDYMRLKDEVLALSISAQRLEGYEVLEGMNEETDKHVREFCRFDLTRPIRGAGPGVVRKLLLEETLKIKGRKDSKLEVVALLFSDVLLVTKAQKKAERLKVVRPPLALDSARCAALKDGCSFVLVEVSDLGCAANVYAFSASNSDSCSKWVSAIQQAQETLKNLRVTEVNRSLQAQKKPLQLEFTSPADAPLSNGGTVELVHDQSECAPSLEAKPVEEPPVIPFANGTLSSMVKLKTPKPNTKGDTQVTGLLGRERLISDTHSKSVHGDFAGWANKIKQGDRKLEKGVWSEAGVRKNRGGDQLEEGYDVVFQGVTERRVTWNRHKPAMTPDLSDTFISSQDAGGTVNTKSNRRQFLFPGEYPDIDYPLTRPRSCAFLHSYKENLPEGSVPQFMSQLSQGEKNKSSETHLDSESTENQAKMESCSQSEEEALTEYRRFSRKLKSPRLRRRRPVNGQQNVLPESPRRGSVPAVWPLSQTNSSSNSDSEVKQQIPASCGSSGRGSTDSRLVLKLGSLKRNGEDFWHMPAEKVSPDPQTISDPELTHEKPATKSHKIPKFKSQRSVSNPDLILPNEQLRPSRLHIPHSPPGDPDLPPLPSPPGGLAGASQGEEQGPGQGKERRKEARIHKSSVEPVFLSLLLHHDIAVHQRRRQRDGVGGGGVGPASSPHHQPGVEGRNSGRGSRGEQELSCLS